VPKERKDGAAETFVLTEEFRRAIRRWEDAPHNQPGQDKTWVDRLLADSRDHHRRAVRVR